MNRLHFPQTLSPTQNLDGQPSKKGGLKILLAFTRLGYVLLCEPLIRIFSDHRNLLFVFCPTLLLALPRRHKVMIVQRWAVYLSQFGYQIEHVNGENSVMPDVMTRWLHGYEENGAAVKCVSHLLMKHDIFPSSTDRTLEWPHISDLRKAQNTYNENVPKFASKGASGIVLFHYKMWVPEDSEDLHLCILITEHCGNSGHRGAESAASIIHKNYTWSTIDEDAITFVAHYIHCILAKSGKKNPRPLSVTLHTTMSNDVVRFDCLYTGASSTDKRYMFVIKEDLSSYVWLIPAEAAHAENAAQALLRWIRSSTAMSHLVSDQGTHFKNSVLTVPAESYRSHHQFTLLHSPWLNSNVENVNRHIQAGRRAISTELRLGPHALHDFISLTQ